MLEDAREVALRRSVGLRSAGDFDCERVLGAGLEVFGDVERVRHEVALGVAEVRAVEPDIALVEQPIEGEPHPRLRLGLDGVLEVRSVEQRAVGVRECAHGSPVPGHRDRLPAVICERRIGEVAAKVVVRDRGPPSAVEVH